MKSERRQRFLLRYTLMFGTVMAAVAAICVLSGVGMVRGLDGPAQHYNAIAYLGEYIRAGLSGEGWKMVDFGLGQGLDVLTTLSYYCFTEPLAWLSALAPVEGAEMFFSALLFFRFYLAGVFAAMLAKRHGAEGWGAAAGGAMYAFGCYALLGGMKHFNFGVGMLLLPLLLLAVERVFRKGKWGAYVAVVAVQLISSFYFAFMNTVICILYILVRLVQALTEGEAVSKCAKDGGKLLGGYVLGAGVSAAFFLPVAMAFLAGGRTGMETGYSASMLSYPLSYYVKLFEGFFGTATVPGYWTVVGFVPLSAFAVCAFFFKQGKERLAVKVMLCVCAMMLCVPLAGKIMNGMGYVSNRWCYAMALFIALASAAGFRDLKTIRKGWAIALAAVCMAYAALVLVRNRTAGAALEFVLFALAALVVLGGAVKLRGLHGRGFGRAVCALVTLSLLSCAMFSYLPMGDNLASDAYPVGRVLDDSRNRMSAFKGTAEDEFYRVGHAFNTVTEHTGLYDNHAWRLGYNGVSYYWSILPSVVSEHYVDTYSNTLIYYYLLSGLGGDAGTNTLASVKRLLGAEESLDAIPQGFEAAGTADVGDGIHHILYENRYALPIGYTFDAYMTEEEYDRLHPMEKRDALLTCAVVEESVDGLLAVPDGRASGSVALAADGPCLLTDGMKIACEVPAEGEVFLVFHGAKHDFTQKTFATDFDAYGPAGGNRAYISNRASNFAYPQKGVILPMGVCQPGEAEFTLKMLEGAAFECDVVEVFFRASEDYDRMASALGEDVLENVEVGTNRVSGTISLDERKWLQLAIPYSEGWTATVDGEKAELARSGGMYMGLALDAGEHVIELEYCTPYLKVGAAVSAVSLVLWAVLAAASRKRRASGK